MPPPTAGIAGSAALPLDLPDYAPPAIPPTTFAGGAAGTLAPEPAGSPEPPPAPAEGQGSLPEWAAGQSEERRRFRGRWRENLKYNIPLGTTTADSAFQEAGFQEAGFRPPESSPPGQQPPADGSRPGGGFRRRWQENLKYNLPQPKPEPITSSQPAESPTVDHPPAPRPAAFQPPPDAPAVPRPPLSLEPRESVHPVQPGGAMQPGGPTHAGGPMQPGDAGEPKTRVGSRWRENLKFNRSLEFEQPKPFLPLLQGPENQDADFQHANDFRPAEFPGAAPAPLPSPPPAPKPAPPPASGSPSGAGTQTGALSLKDMLAANPVVPPPSERVVLPVDMPPFESSVPDLPDPFLPLAPATLEHRLKIEFAHSQAEPGWRSEFEPGSELELELELEPSSEPELEPEHESEPEPASELEPELVSQPEPVAQLEFEPSSEPELEPEPEREAEAITGADCDVSLSVGWAADFEPPEPSKAPVEAAARELPEGEPVPARPELLGPAEAMSEDQFFSEAEVATPLLPAPGPGSGLRLPAELEPQAELQVEPKSGPQAELQAEPDPAPQVEPQSHPEPEPQPEPEAAQEQEFAPGKPASWAALAAAAAAAANKPPVAPQPTEEAAKPPLPEMFSKAASTGPPQKSEGAETIPVFEQKSGVWSAGPGAPKTKDRRELPAQDPLTKTQDMPEFYNRRPRGLRTGSKPPPPKKRKTVRVASVSPETLAVFTRQLAVMIGAGVPIHQALSFYAESADEKGLPEVVDDVAQKVSSGFRLSQALKTHPHIFSEVYTGLVETGESSSMLQEILEKLADLLEKQNKVRKKVISTLTYPIVLTLVSLGSIAVFIFYVLPMMIPLFNSMNLSLPWPTRMLLAFRLYAPPVVLAAGGLVVLFSMLRRHVTAERWPKLRRFWHASTLKIPMVGKVLEKIVVARVLYSLATMLESGVLITAAMQRCATVAGNLEVADRLLKAKDELIDGKSVAEALTLHEVFPRGCVQIMCVGEETSSLSDTVRYAANFYEEDIDQTLTSFASMIEPMIMGVMGLFVGFIVLSAVLPTVQLLNNL